MADLTDKLPWLALRNLPGVGVVLFQRLAARFGGPAAVFQASPAELQSVRGVSPALAQAIRAFKDWHRVEEQLLRLQNWGGSLLTWDEADFPARLRQIPYPPPCLFVKGSLKAADDQAVALVGTRGASYYGLKTSRRLAGGLAARGLTIVSGLARGIDAAAHRGALENGGRTLAVLGCGLDVVYPPENREFYQQIPEQGALITEFPLGAPPEARNFPVRNRIISGLSLGVVVVEAGVKSGTAITVQFALDQGREVFAVPGPIDSPTSIGPHRLIQQGAKLVMDVEDVLQELPGMKRRGRGPLFSGPSRVAESPSPGASPPEDPLLACLGSDPLRLDELVQAAKLPASEVMSRLTLLELQGLVRELPGKCYVLEN